MTAESGSTGSENGTGFTSSEFREEEDANGLTAREVFGVVRRRWILVVTVFAIVTAIGGWRTMRQPRIYQSTATVRFQQPTPAVQGIGGPQSVRNFMVE